MLNMNRTTKIISISLPPKIATEFEKTANFEEKTNSELFRVAFEHYMKNKRKFIIIPFVSEKEQEDIEKRYGRPEKRTVKTYKIKV